MGKVVQNDWLPQQLSTNDDDNDDVDKGTNKNSSSEDENQKVGIWPEGGGTSYIFCFQHWRHWQCQLRLKSQ